ncbi:MAG: hypothetical protein MN733_20660 [Nitrososphaera sp.]|nr:hypothetical protein [Nitrososphaera sp.]
MMKWVIDISSIVGGTIAVLGFFFGIYHVKELMNYVKKGFGKISHIGASRKAAINKLSTSVTLENVATGVFLLLYAVFLSLFFVFIVALIFGPTVQVLRMQTLQQVFFFIIVLVGIICFIEAILGWTDKSIYLVDLAFEAIVGCVISAGLTYFFSIFLALIGSVPRLPTGIKDTLLLFDWGLGPSKPLALLVIGVGIYGGIWAVLDRRKKLNQGISQG